MTNVRTIYEINSATVSAISPQNGSRGHGTYRMSKFVTQLDEKDQQHLFKKKKTTYEHMLNLFSLYFFFVNNLFKSNILIIKVKLSTSYTLQK